MPSGPCAIEGCAQPALKRGWCSRHYQRWYNHGDPLGGRATPIPDEVQGAYLQSIIDAPWPDDCVVWPFSRTERGYGVATIDGVRIAAHRASCKLAHGEPPTPEHQAAHSCGKGDDGCVNPKHLRWATPMENAADMKVHGTVLVGSTNPAASLTDEQVLAIYALRGKQPQKHIAAMFGSTQATVADIHRGASWATVTGAVYARRYRETRAAA